MQKTNNAAPVQCTKSIEIFSPVDKVWSIMADINNWQSWQTDIKKPHLLGQLQEGAVFTWHTGGAKIRSVLHTVKPGVELGWTGKTYGMFAIHNWSFISIPSGTKVIVDESMQGFLATLFKRTFNKNLERDMQHWLELLKLEAERKIYFF